MADFSTPLTSTTVAVGGDAGVIVDDALPRDCSAPGFTPPGFCSSCEEAPLCFASVTVMTVGVVAETTPGEAVLLAGAGAFVRLATDPPIAATYTTPL